MAIEETQEKLLQVSGSRTADYWQCCDHDPPSPLRVLVQMVTVYKQRADRTVNIKYFVSSALISGRVLIYKVSRFRPIVLPVVLACGWRSVRRIGGMVLTAEN